MGYGSYLIRQLKSYMISSQEKYQFIVACADENAVEFFKKHSFNENPVMDPILYQRYTKDYEGSKKMECLVDYRIDPTKIHLTLKQKLEEEEERLRKKYV